jgi:ABC-type transport system involved in multi-copper enzyme maturation permease subunit
MNPVLILAWIVTIISILATLIFYLCGEDGDDYLMFIVCAGLTTILILTIVPITISETIRLADIAMNSTTKPPHRD